MKHHIRQVVLLAAMALVVAACGGGDGETATTPTTVASATTTTATTPTTTTTAAPVTTTSTTTTTEAPPALLVAMAGDELLTPVSVAWYPDFGMSYLYAEFEVQGDTAWELMEFSAGAYDESGTMLGTTSATYYPYVMRPGQTVLFMGTYFEGEIEPASVEFTTVTSEEYSANEFYRAGDGLVVSAVEAYKEGGNWYVSGVVTNDGDYTEHVGVIAAVYDADGTIVGAELVDEYTLPEMAVLESGASVDFVVEVWPHGDVVSAKAVADGFFSEFNNG